MNNANMKTGIAWYTRETYEKLLLHAADRESICDTYEEWLESYNRAVKGLRNRGIKAVPIPVDLDELIKWCRENNVPNTGESRSRFVSGILVKKFG